ncbi:MAG: hypothetical protein ACKVZJ_03765 [Phycisphaerales bacterium]
MSRAELTRWNLIAAGCAVAPLVLVSAVPSLMGTGPRLSIGASPAAVENAPNVGTPRATPDQLAALERVRALRTASVGESPFRPAPAPVEAPEPAPTPEPVPAPALMAPPELTIRGVMRQADGSVRALIGGKLKGVGDEVAPGWTISAIDAGARSVTLTSSDGQTHTIAPK